MQLQQQLLAAVNKKPLYSFKRATLAYINKKVCRIEMVNLEILFLAL
jgi:hypothetical protein